MIDHSSKISIIIHGGSGRVSEQRMPPDKDVAYRSKLSEAAKTGFSILRNGGSSIDAVEKAIRILEDSPLFNAGRGAVYSNDELVELDASIMDGRTLEAGAVAGVTTIRNPISAARSVMEKSQHVMMTGSGAEKFAQQAGLETVDQSYFRVEERWQQIQELKIKEASPSPQPLSSKLGTVGAVALDRNGSLAAGTSTGGMLNKKWGRVGDSPIIGAGTYANAVCAVSGTGWGEFFIRHTVARDIAALMEYKGMSVNEAASEVIFNKVGATGGFGGVIVLDAFGKKAAVHNTEGMFWAHIEAESVETINVCNMIIE